MEMDNQPNQTGPNPGPSPDPAQTGPAPGTASGPMPPQPQQPMGSNPQPMQPNAHKTDTLGIISLVMIVVFPLVGAILGFIGMSKAKKEGYPKTLSMIGAIVNSILTVLGTILIIIWIFVIGTVFNEVGKNIDVLIDDEDWNSTVQQTSDEDSIYNWSVPVYVEGWEAVLLDQGGVNSFRSKTSSCNLSTYQNIGVNSSLERGYTLGDSVEAQAKLTTNSSTDSDLSQTGIKNFSIIGGDSIDFNVYEASYNNMAGNLRIYGQWHGDTELMIVVGCLRSDWISNQAEIDTFIEKIKVSTT